nr:TonB-dependent receptor [Granulicella arctica]
MVVAGITVLAGSVRCAAQTDHPVPNETVQSPAVDAQPTAPVAQGGTIRGTVKAGPVPLPGVSVTATNTLTGKRYATTTDVSGAFAMVIPGNGRYVVKTELAAFASDTKEVLLNAASQNGGKPEQVADFTMQLASRVEAQQAKAAAVGTASTGRGLQSLSVSGADSGLSNASATGGVTGAQMPTLSGIGTGDGAFATDSVTVSGQTGQTNGLATFNEDEIRQRIQDAVAQAQRQGGAAGDMANAVVGMLGGMMGGPGGGFGGGPGGGGGRGGRGGGGGFRGMNPTQPHGAIFYQGSNGALNATTYSLTGAPEEKPSYSQNKFGVSFTGSPFIPGLLKASTKQFIFFNLTGQRNINPDNFYGTVPTLAERGGDFSQLTQNVSGVATAVPIYDPTTHNQFPNNVIPTARLSPQALALLNYYPAPNIALVGTQGYNYQTITTAGSNSTQAALRYVRNFGQTPTFGGGRGGGGRQGANTSKSLRQNINFNGSYSHVATDSPNIFLPLGGAGSTTGYGITAGYTIGYGRLTNNASVNWNRSNSETRNYLTNGSVNPAAEAGILVGSAAVQSNPFNYGVPTVTFSGFTGLSETSPSQSIGQTISFSDFVSWSHKKHNMRYGLDIRRVHADTFGSSNVLGSFTFTGYATESPLATAASSTSTVQQSSGAGFADFLLGLPQQSAVQAGLQKTYLRANVFDWYAQDDWRALPSLTLNYGIRYEYFSPYIEKYNHLVNLDHNASFSEIAAVEPDQVGAYGGVYPRSLVHPDRDMYSPRFGFAYRLKYLKNTVLRGGYGINYNTGQYATIAKQFAFQPPYAVTQTNIVNQQGCGTFTLANAFNCSDATVQSNYAANPGYRLGHVQIWNLVLQKTFPLGIVTNIGFNGSKGGGLDVLRAPNRTATGLLNNSAQAFNYEDSQAYSRFEALNVNVSKRLQKGVSLTANYQYGHSIDNSSSIGGASQVPAQNDLDLNAEEGNSVFDVRQQVTGTWILELPFGPNRVFFTKGGFWSKALDGFSLSGDYTFATGMYYTPRYLATVSETNTGANNSLRPDRNFAVPIAGAGSIHDWFNKDAFTAPANVYGTASRGSIEGPGKVVVDMSLSRTVQLGDTRSFEARMTAANALNTVQYSGINTTLDSPTFGQVSSTAAQRTITFIARYRF